MIEVEQQDVRLTTVDARMCSKVIGHGRDDPGPLLVPARSRAFQVRTRCSPVVFAPVRATTVTTPNSSSSGLLVLDREHIERLDPAASRASAREILVGAVGELRFSDRGHLEFL
jgi:hypothetical protein